MKSWVTIEQWVRTASDELHLAGMPRLVVRLMAWLRGSDV